jgi:hypothetical protein
LAAGTASDDRVSTEGDGPRKITADLAPQRAAGSVDTARDLTAPVAAASTCGSFARGSRGVFAPSRRPDVDGTVALPGIAQRIEARVQAASTCNEPEDK